MASDIPRPDRSLVHRYLAGAGRWGERLAVAGGPTLLLATGPAAAHAGTTHAGTPHWLLAVLVGVGLALVAAGVLGVRRTDLAPRFLAGVGVGGLLLTMFGLIGLVEIQLTPRAAPGWAGETGDLTLLAGLLLAVGSLAVGYHYWRDRPRYSLLGILLGGWVAYPGLFPNGGLLNPVGYLLAAAVPAAVGYVVWTDAGGDVVEVLGERVPLLAGTTGLALFAVFFSFSAGALTLNPDLGPGVPQAGYVTMYRVASPLVYWPAVEFYLPAVPLSGFVSLGTLLLVGILGGLLALNIAFLAEQFTARGRLELSRESLGALATTGATACCCCAPASYAALSVLLGTASSPFYWAFMDPTSPVGGLFFATSVLVLTGSLVQTASQRHTVPTAASGPTGASG